MNQKIVLIALAACIVLLSGCIEPQEKRDDDFCDTDAGENPNYFQ